MVLRVGYIREQFASPLLQVKDATFRLLSAEADHFSSYGMGQFAEQDKGNTFKLVECPSGTGQVISRLSNNEIDVAIALTDPLLAGIAKGSTAYKLVGSYVTTPLNWAVVAGAKSEYQKIEDLRGSTMGISRVGSGSQVMAYVMALQQGWVNPETKVVEEMRFKVNNDIDGLIRSLDDGSTSAFMWEWFTTKPWLDRGEARFIGSVPTPWASWMIAAQAKDPSETDAFDFLVSNWLESLTTYINRFNATDISIKVKYINNLFGYREDDIRSWLLTVAWTLNTKDIRETTLMDTLDVLHTANVVPASYSTSVAKYVNTDIANVIRTSDELATKSK